MLTLKDRILFSAVVVGLAYSWVGYQHVGPTAPVPQASPAKAWNAAHAELEDNAADLYEQAFAKLDLPDHDGWWPGDYRLGSGEPVPAEIREWLKRNAAALILAERASSRDDCWFRMDETVDLVDTLGPIGDFRQLSRLYALCVARAFERRDWQRAADLLIVMDRVAGHTGEMPTFFAVAVQYAQQALCHSLLLEPLEWPELSPQERAAYCRRVAVIDVSAADMARHFEEERDAMVWLCIAPLRDVPNVNLVLPLARVSGEIHAGREPLSALVRQTAAERCDWANPLYEQIAKSHERFQKASWLSLPRLVASVVDVYPLRVVNMHDRILAWRRGNRTVLEIFIHRAEQGEFPETLGALTELPDEYRTDPFSGGPFVYRRSEDGFTLYSVGFDRDDDGGVHTRIRSLDHDRLERIESLPDGDFVYWPIPERAGREDAVEAGPRGNAELSSSD